MKRCMVDSSSAILLYKSGLFDILVGTYCVAMTDSVYKELTLSGYPGAREFHGYVKSGVITTQSPPPRPSADRQDLSLYSLDRGERDTVRCYNPKGDITFLVIDDGRAVRYCLQAGIPFINGLLFARIACLAGLLRKSEYDEKHEELVQIGRYGPEVIAFVRQCTYQEIALFLP